MNFRNSLATSLFALAMLALLPTVASAATATPTCLPLGLGPEETVSEIFQTVHGIWITTSEAAYLKAKSPDGSAQAPGQAELPETVLQGLVSAVLEFSPDNVLLGTSRGLWVWSRDGVEPLAPFEAHEILALEALEPASVLVGTSHGMFMLDSLDATATGPNLLTVNGEPQSESVTSLAVLLPPASSVGTEAARPEIVVGTNNNLWHIDQDFEATRLFSHPSGKVVKEVVGSGDDILAILKTPGKDFQRISYLSKTSSQTSEPEKPEYPFGDSHTWAVEAIKLPSTKGDSLWFSRRDGLSVQTDGQSYISLFSNPNIYTIAGTDQHLIVGTETGLFSAQLQAEPSVGTTQETFLKKHVDTGDFFRPISLPGADSAIKQVKAIGSKVWFERQGQLCSIDVSVLEDEEPEKRDTESRIPPFAIVLLVVVTLLVAIVLLKRPGIPTDGI